jgi:uncharacterized RDD family membrane protein YckC
MTDEHDETPEAQAPVPFGDPPSTEPGQEAYVPPHWETPQAPATIENLAGFGWRAAGYLIDTIMVTAVISVLAGALHAGALGLIAMNFVAASLYGALLLALWDGHTVGMRVFRLRCVDATTQAPVTMQQAFIRSLTAQAFVVLEVFGFFGSLAEVADLLWPLWDKRNQTLHDKVGKTVVLRELVPTR